MVLLDVIDDVEVFLRFVDCFNNLVDRFVYGISNNIENTIAAK